MEIGDDMRAARRPGRLAGRREQSLSQGELIATNASEEIYVIINEKRCHIPDEETFRHLRFRPSEVQTVSNTQLQTIAVGAPLPSFKKQEEEAVVASRPSDVDPDLPDIEQDEASNSVRPRIYVGVGLSIIAAVVLALTIPRLLPYSPTLTAAQRQTAISASQATFAQIFAAAGAVSGLLWAARNYRLSKRSLGAETADQTSERFAQAAELAALSQESTEIRMAGLYALSKIARVSKTDRIQTAEYITALLRLSSQLRGRIKQEFEIMFDALRLARLHGCISTYDLTGVAVEGLQKSQLILQSSILDKTDFANIMALYSDLSRSVLLDAAWSRVDLRKSDLRHLRVRNSTFEKCDFSWSQLHGSVFINVDMRGTSFVKCQFDGVTLFGVAFQGADFRDTDLSKISLTDLLSCNLRGARKDRKTMLPPGFNADEAGMVEGAIGSDI